MRLGRIKNRLTGEIIDVKATTKHPDSHHGIPVWVGQDNVAYLQCDMQMPNPVYDLVYDSQSGRAKVGALVAELRNRRGLTVRELAEQAGIDPANICKIERGAYNVSVDVLTKVLQPMGAELGIIEKAAE